MDKDGRKWIKMGNEKTFMRDIFELADHEIDEVKKFMEQEFRDIFGLMKLLIKSDLNLKQKMLASYIMGNVGFQISNRIGGNIADIPMEVT